MSTVLREPPTCRCSSLVKPTTMRIGRSSHASISVTVDHATHIVCCDRYKQLFFGMDLSDFCFSYTYDLTHSLQHNITSQSAPQYDDRFVWNHFLLQPLIKGKFLCISLYTRWTRISITLTPSIDWPQRSVRVPAGSCR